jgi:hypothetical protein
LNRFKFALTTAGIIAAVGGISVASANSGHHHSGPGLGSLSGYTKDQCKDGGWKTFGVFKNQGDCVSFFASNGRNQPSGH